MSQPSIDLAGDLLECVSHLEPTGSTKTFGLFEVEINPPNPGLCLKHGGPIGLPLSEGDSKVFRTAADLSPFKSSFGNSVWVLPADDFEIQNPAWELFLHGITTKVSAGLGVDSSGKSVSAKLSSLSLLDPSPESTQVEVARELNPRSFGTLIITLPTKYEGGEISLSCGSTQVPEACQISTFNASYAAWFSDVTHELKPVSSGRRLFLTYKLFHSTLGPDVLSAGSNKSMAKLDMLFSYWKDNVEEETSMLAYLLHDKIDDDKLSYNGLEGANLEVLTYLREAAEKYGFCIYLASMKRSIECGEYDYYDDRMYEREIDQSEAESILERVVGLDGIEVAKGIPFEDDILIQPDPFEGVEPDDEDHSGTVIYRRTVALFMPKQYRIGYFLTPTFPRFERNYWGGSSTADTTYAPDVKGWVDRLLASFNQSGNLSDRQDLEEICRLVTSSMRYWKRRESHGIKEQQPFSSADISSLVSASVDLDNKEMFLETFDVCPHKIPASSFRSIGRALLRYGMVSLLPKLSSLVAALDNVSGRFDIINAVQEGLALEIQRDFHLDVTDYQAWVDDEANRTICNFFVKITSAEDGVALANYCQALPHSDMLNKVLLAVTRNINYTPMVLSFLLSIFSAGNLAKISQDMVRAVFANIMSTMVSRFKLQALDTLIFPTPIGPSTALYDHWLRPKLPVLYSERSRDIAMLLCQCESLGLSTELNLITINLLEEAKTIKLDHFEILFLPFLEDLGCSILALNVAVQLSPLQSLVQQILSIYVQRFVRPEPQRSRDWSRSTIICESGCQDCSSVNKFLADPTQRTQSFTINAKRREHVSSKVSETGIGQHTERTSGCFSLVLIKNDEYFNIVHKAWEERCTIARGHLQRIDEKVDLKPLLAEYYDSIMSLSIVSGYTSPPLPIPNLPTPGSQYIPQPLHTMDNNIQRTGRLPTIPSTLSSTISGLWGSLPPPGSINTHETRIVPQGTKRKASDPLEQEQSSKRIANEVIVLDD